MNRHALALLLLVLLLPTVSVQAATSCTAQGNDLDFGKVVLAGVADTSGTITVNCSSTALALAGTTRVRMCLNIGTGSTGANPRTMQNAQGDSMRFDLYQDAARTVAWGDSSSGGSSLNLDLQYSVPLIGGNGSISATLYGRVPAQYGLAEGTFSSNFSGAHTRLDYRYAEAMLLTPPYPSSCLSGGTGGGSVTFPFTSTASVDPNCQITTVNNLQFSAQSGLIDSASDTSTTIGILCTGRTAWNVGLDNGNHVGTSNRRMRQSTADVFVDYDLYRDAARSQVWGNTIGSNTSAGSGTGNVQSLTIYGRVLAPQSVPAGSYSDTITITLTY